MKILVLNLNIQNFSGSEINAMQICQGLKSIGHEAEIGTLILDSPMRELVTDKGIKVRYLFENDPEPFEYDLIWAHHAPVLAYLLFKKNIKDTRILFSSLSPIIPLEVPPVFLEDIHYFLSLSKLNETAMINTGVPAERIHIFPNYAPESYFLSTRQTHSGSPNRIAVVSNHPPKEVREFALLAHQNSTIVDFYGTNDNYTFVDHDLLLRYDLVITIGKTVQYCLALKIPVYSYDHFGGFGFIDPGNYDRAQPSFAGRLCNIHRDRDELYADIFGNYQNNLSNLDFLYKKCRENFCLETNLKNIVKDFENIPITNVQAFREKNILAERIYDAYIDLLRHIFFPEERVFTRRNDNGESESKQEAVQEATLSEPSQKSTTDRREIQHILSPMEILLRKLRFRHNKRYLSLLRSSRFFNQEWYLEQNPDVKAAGVDPAWHFLLYGGYEGRDPSPEFSSSWYLHNYPDVRKASINPLVHYLLFGHNENRSPKKR